MYPLTGFCTKKSVYRMNIWMQRAIRRVFEEHSVVPARGRLRPLCCTRGQRYPKAFDYSVFYMIWERVHGLSVQDCK
jgi:hypothetical protein